MENINVTINRETRMVNLSKVMLGNDGENLQENLVFSFSDEFVDGTGRLEMTMPDDTSSYVMLSKINSTYQIPVRSIMTEEGKISMQLVITEGTNEEDIPVFKSNVFSLKVRKSINAEIEEPEGYTQWLDVANTKLNQMDNLDIDAEQTSSGATISITKKNGTIETVNLTNGEDGLPGRDGANGITPTIGDNGNWYLGETDTGKPSRGIQGEQGVKGDKGDKGDTGAQGIQGPKGDKGDTGNTGAQGRDGYVQYTAGDNITIENNVISAIGGSNINVGIIYNAGQQNNTNTFIIDNLKKGLYIFKDIESYYNSLYYKWKENYFSFTDISLQMRSSVKLFLVIEKDLDEIIDENVFEKIGYLIVARKGGSGEANYEGRYQIFEFHVKKSAEQVSIVFANNESPKIYFVTENNQYWYGLKYFDTIPQQSSTTAPTLDTQFTNKKYVDDSIASAITTTLGGSY